MDGGEDTPIPVRSANGPIANRRFTTSKRNVADKVQAQPTTITLEFYAAASSGISAVLINSFAYRFAAEMLCL